MGKILFVEPVGTTNLLDTPSFEDTVLGVSNLTAVGSTVTRSNEEARFGRSSAKVVTDGAAFQLEGAYYAYSTPAALANLPLTASVYARGSGKVRLRIDEQSNGQIRATDPIALKSDFWQRLSLTMPMLAATGGDFRMYVEVFPGDPNNIRAFTYYLDGFQLEALGYPTTYCDGDIERELRPHDGEAFFKWDGTRHNAPSTRSGRYREGGRLKDITQGLDFELWPTNISGFGMPRIRLQTMSFDTLDDVLVQRSRPRPRALTMQFWASHTNRQNPGVQRSSPANLRILHRARRALETIVKPDLVQETQPIIVRYENSTVPMELPAFYETGLEFSGDLRNPYQNQFSARFFTPDPVWKVDSQDQQELTDQQLIAHDGLLARIDGEWQGHDTSGGDVLCIAVHPETGDVYVGGDFSDMDGDPDCARICKFPRDGSDVEPLDVGIDDGEVRVISFLSDGSLVIGGSFTDIDGVAFNNVALYDPDTDTFTVMGPDPGLDAAVNAAAAHADGDTIYLGGEFTESFSGTVTPLNKICEYSIGVDDYQDLTGANGNGVDGTVDEMIMDLDGTTLLFCGAFTQETGAGANTLKRVGIWVPSTFTQMGQDGAEARVRYLRMAQNGHVYVCGDFTNIGYNNAEKCAVWNRNDFFPLGDDTDGLTGGVSGFALAVDKRGLVAFVGDFTGATGIDSDFIDGVTTWNGTRFGLVDIVPATNGGVFAVAFNGDDLWIGGQIDGNARASEIHTVTNNGEAKAGPLLDVVGPASIYWLENQSNGQKIEMQFEILAEEELLVDFRAGHLRAISSFRGNVIAEILPGSNRLELLPGDNTVAFLANGTTGSTEHVLRWQDRHWSFDD